MIESWLENTVQEITCEFGQYKSQFNLRGNHHCDWHVLCMFSSLVATQTVYDGLKFCCQRNAISLCNLASYVAICFENNHA